MVGVLDLRPVSLISGVLDLPSLISPEISETGLSQVVVRGCCQRTPVELGPPPPFVLVCQKSAGSLVGKFRFVRVFFVVLRACPFCPVIFVRPAFCLLFASLPFFSPFLSLACPYLLSSFFLLFFCPFCPGGINRSMNYAISCGTPVVSV